MPCIFNALQLHISRDIVINKYNPKSLIYPYRYSTDEYIINETPRTSAGNKFNKSSNITSKDQNEEKVEQNQTEEPKVI